MKNNKRSILKMVNWTKHAKSLRNVSNELIRRKCKIFRLTDRPIESSNIRWHWNNQRPSGCSLNDRRNFLFFCFVSNTMRIKVCVQLSAKNDLAFGWTFCDRLDEWKYSIKYYFQHLISMKMQDWHYTKSVDCWWCSFYFILFSVYR